MGPVTVPTSLLTTTMFYDISSCWCFSPYQISIRGDLLPPQAQSISSTLFSMPVSLTIIIFLRKTVANSYTSQGVIQVILVDFILALRIWGMYSRSKKLLFFLVGFGTVCGLSAIFLANWIHWITSGELKIYPSPS